ncbi:MAG: ATP-binding cassette domain-containing protein, partial [Acidimicrobiales bacterium]|nr:ATP-binding cassette domain-containing protein [Acidimicrobiales bacterium]
MPAVETRMTGPLRPIELATAAVLGGLAVVLTVVGWFLPHLGLIAAFAVVPLGVVAHHHRLRALLASAFAACVLSFLVAGTGTVSNIVECAAIGGLVGIAKRREWSLRLVALGVAVIGPVLAAISVGLLALFSSLRKLTLTQFRNTWKGIRKIVGGLLQQVGLLGPIDHFVNAALRDWWVTVAVVVMGATVWFAVLGWVFIGAVLERLKWIRATDRLDVGPDLAEPGPLPVTLSGVSYRYPGTDHDAIDGVTLTISPGEMVALVGDNGSGKSTLSRILAGRSATGGTISRPGAAALGRHGGTAMILQHPETQVLGVRVADDIVWGLHDATGIDIEDVLAQVGLAGFAERETSGLSGGELQRLAVAAALVRQPRLLISDESTAMVDEAGRRDLTALLRSLPTQNHGMAVVHVTHRPEEAKVADRRFRMQSGRLLPDDELLQPRGPVEGRAASGLGIASEEPNRPAALELIGVSHTYGLGTPWAQSAVRGVDLKVGPEEGVLIVGGNGSGKSTLAWIMAGLLRPTFGECLLGDAPVRGQVGSVGLAFQHARLQVQRATVGRDVRAAGAPDDEAVAAALAGVGLDAAEFAERRVDAL